MKIVACFRSLSLILIGLFAVETAFGAPPARRQPPRGQVHLDGRAVADARGPFNAFGATLFWGAWGYRSDRARLERNLKSLSDGGVDYVRVLGSVGGTSWEDRPADPRWDDYDAVFTGLTDLAYDHYGLRVQWTLFGGAPFLPPGAAREALVDRVAELARGREQKIFAFEIANEARSNGFGGSDGTAELRRLGKRLNDRTSVLVALSAPAFDGACETYAGAGVDVATIHYPRGFGSEGPTRPLRGPWAYPRGYDEECRGQLPEAVFNNEPIGPQSSVRQDDDPARIAAGYVLTFLAGNAAYVFHSGPGIRGGGAADINSALKRQANFADLPSFAPLMHALQTAASYLPAGLANWTRREADDPLSPILGFDTAQHEHAITGAYTAESGSSFITLVVGIKHPLTLRVRHAASIELRRPDSPEVLRHLELRAGDAFRVDGPEHLVLIGRRRPD